MYLDSAILVKLLVREPDSLFYAKRVDGLTEVWSSQLALAECCSALCRKEREGSIDGTTRRRAWKRLEGWLAEGGLRVLPIDEPILRRAVAIIERCHPEVSIRSLDAIHLASCESLAAFPLLTNDQRLREAADHLRLPLGELPSRKGALE